MFLFKEANNQVEGNKAQMHKTKYMKNVYDIYLPFLIKRNLFIPCPILLKFSFIPFLRTRDILRYYKARLTLTGIEVEPFYRYRFLYQIFIFYIS